MIFVLQGAFGNVSRYLGIVTAATGRGTAPGMGWAGAGDTQGRSLRQRTFQPRMSMLQRSRNPGWEKYLPRVFSTYKCYRNGFKWRRIRAPLQQNVSEPLKYVYTRMSLSGMWSDVLDCGGFFPPPPLPPPPPSPSSSSSSSSSSASSSSSSSH